MKKRGTYTEVEVYVLFVCLKLGKNFLVNEKNYLPVLTTMNIYCGQLEDLDKISPFVNKTFDPFNAYCGKEETL